MGHYDKHGFWFESDSDDPCWPPPARPLRADALDSLDGDEEPEEDDGNE